MAVIVAFLLVFPGLAHAANTWEHPRAGSLAASATAVDDAVVDRLTDAPGSDAVDESWTGSRSDRHAASCGPDPAPAAATGAASRWSMESGPAVSPAPPGRARPAAVVASVPHGLGSTVDRGVHAPIGACVSRR